MAPVIEVTVTRNILVADEKQDPDNRGCYSEDENDTQCERIRFHDINISRQC